METIKFYNLRVTKISSSAYTCPECGLSYKEKDLAKKCEAWCKKYNSCNLEITKHSVNKQSFSANKKRL